MTQTLFPDRTVTVPVNLAATLGLEEATLLTLLRDAMPFLQMEQHASQQWYRIDSHLLEQLAPFWNEQDIQRLATSLRNTGILLLGSAPYSQSRELQFAVNERSQTRSAAQPVAPKPQQNRFANTIPSNWQPSQDNLRQLAQLNIPEHFAREMLPEFVAYWQETGQAHHAWGAKFISHVRRRWPEHQQRLAREAQRKAPETLAEDWQPSAEILQQIGEEGIASTFVSKCLPPFKRHFLASGQTASSWDTRFFKWVLEDWERLDAPFKNRRKTPMQKGWQPQEHDWELVRRCAIDLDFAREVLPEFVHHWLSREGYSDAWGDQFVQYVRNEWAFYCAGIDKNPVPKPISQSWRPTPETMEHITGQCDIPRDFALKLLPEFILYWRTAREPKRNWDAVFLRNVRWHWAKHNEIQPEFDQHGKSTRSSSLYQDLTDTSWA
ncbi:DnaT-like ssDNA-binding domain-containing protein [Biformimicrobium ophioploci]|uniref:DnaT DNA-binding domain-containing protein n=1 Tax=Biformimicrobium ophioploci TaxID=3036711 RepID=A0ABQ6M123_9GAMM|nr:DnaT-like ssDNA-binding domain-containing protein [Microbulbifer sp. NKW57]GMG88011.1 hypothetical protein MNKW57_23320 [Microbulbifer sp. NKW57]